MEDFIIVGGMLKKYNGAGGDVVIPEGVTEIGDNAFFGCTSIIFKGEKYPPVPDIK